MKNLEPDKKYKAVHIISNLSLGGAQTLLFDIISYLNLKNDIENYVVTIDSGEYMSKFFDKGFNVIDLKEKGLINPKIYFKLMKTLKKLKPDIVHTHLNKADFYGRIAAKHAGVPLILSTCHNYSTTHTGADINKKSLFDYIDNFVIKYTDSYMIAISQLVYKYLINRNPKFKSKTEVIYNGVNTGKEKYKLNESEQEIFREENKLNKNDFVILISGRLEKQKGQLFFLNSAKEIIKGNKEIKVLILGEGSLKNEIENFIKENSLNDQIKLLGFKKETEKYVEISDLICVPSLWEGFGLVIIEAMIKSRIVLASDVGGIPEIITDNVNGFLFRSNDKINFIDKFNYIYNNRSNLNELKQNALNLVKEKFNIAKSSELYYNCYKNKFLEDK